jgi:predicted ATPase/class 3 adenylate cyclase
VPQPPSGTVTFLFTDIEGSTRLWEDLPEQMREALTLHDKVLRAAVETAGGFVFSTGGDGLAAAFGRAGKGIEAAIGAQQHLATSEWPPGIELRVRMALHTGEAQERDGDYFGSALNRTARLMAAASGGQIVCSRVTADLIRDSLGYEIALVGLGEHWLRDLTHIERVFQINPPGLEHEFPPLRTVDAPAGNLPVQANKFIGRIELIDRISGLIVDNVVVTLTGPGGVGKTRLALQVAATLRHEFPDGTWIVDLAAVNDPNRVVATMLETLGYTLAPGEPGIEGLCARLRRHRILLVIDNCEHLVASVAAVVNAISTGAPNVRVISTSREALGIPAEQILLVTPLDTDTGGEAVELFVTRARAAQPDFTLDAQTRPTVVELCRRLDGIPLAIELAAARTRSIAPAQILERLDERFRLLTGGSRTAVARHQTLQAAVDWSYELLTDPERTVLDRLSVFAGRFTLDAAETVATDSELDAFDVAEQVSALVDKSLVVAEPGEETRFRLLETIRQYVADRLLNSGSSEKVRARHASYYQAMARLIYPDLTGPHDLVCFDRLSADLENLRLMLNWYQEHDQVEVAADVMWQLHLFWIWHDHLIEMITQLETTVPLLGHDDLRLSRVHGQLAWMKAQMGYEGVLEHAERSVRHAKLAGRGSLYHSFHGLATHSMNVRGDTKKAIEQMELAIASARAGGDSFMVTWGRVSLLWFVVLLSPGSEETIRLADEVRREVVQTGSETLRGLWLGAMVLTLISVDPDRALALLDEMVTLAIRSNFPSMLALAEFFRGVVHFVQHRLDETAIAWRRAMVGNYDTGNRQRVLLVLSSVTGLMERVGEEDTAAALLMSLRTARSSYGAPGSEIEQSAERKIGERLARSLRGDGDIDPVRPLDIEAAIDLALDSLDELAIESCQ